MPSEQDKTSEFDTFFRGIGGLLGSDLWASLRHQEPKDVGRIAVHLLGLFHAVDCIAYEMEVWYRGSVPESLKDDYRAEAQQILVALEATMRELDANDDQRAIYEPEPPCSCEHRLVRCRELRQLVKAQKKVVSDFVQRNCSFDGLGGPE